MAVVFLDVGVAVAPRAAHEGDVFLEPALGVPVAVALHKRRQLHRELGVERVLPGLQELVVVDVALSPVLRLVVEDIALRARRFVATPPQDAVGMDSLGRGIAREPGMIAIEGGPVVIPMDRHRDRIGNECPDEGPHGRIVGPGKGIAANVGIVPEGRGRGGTTIGHGRILAKKSRTRGSGQCSNIVDAGPLATTLPLPTNATSSATLRAKPIS